MAKIAVGLVLRERLGESGARELTDFVERHSDEVKSEVMDMCNTRVTGLSVEIAEVNTELSEKVADVKTELSARIAEVKTDVAERIAELRADMTEKLGEIRVDLLRWSFVFWIGQFTAMLAALVAAMAVFVQWIRP